MGTKDELLADLEAGYAELQSAMEGLTHQQKLQKWFGDWCVYDICSHIVGWHHEMDDALERIARGDRPVPEGVDYNDADAWNARFIETWVQSSGETVLAELETSKTLFAAAAREVPEDRLEEGRAAYRIITGTGGDHYREHAAAIREWREREGI